MKAIVFILGLVIALLGVSALRAVIFESILPARVAVLADEGKKLGGLARIAVDVDTFAVNHSWLTVVVLLAWTIVAWRSFVHWSKSASIIGAAALTVMLFVVPVLALYMITWGLILWN